MNMQQLRYARALAECGSFVQAANHCGVTQPTLSNGIAQLESELGQQLFARTTRTVSLTEAGTHLLPDIADILNAQAALMARARALSHPERRLMRIGVSPVVSVKFVALVIEPFRLENPDIEVVFREMNLAEMVTLLEGGQLDFVFGPVDAMPSGQTAFDSAAFREEPLVFVPSSSTKAKYLRAKSVSLKEIAGETFVMVPDTCGLTRTTRAIQTEAPEAERIFRQGDELWRSSGVGRTRHRFGRPSALQTPRKQRRRNPDRRRCGSAPNSLPQFVAGRSKRDA